MATEILAENLNRLIGPGKYFASNEAADSRSKVGRSTFDRARRMETSVRLDKLSAIAAAFGLEPWQILVPDADPSAPPKLASAVAPIRELPPDEAALLRYYRELSADYREMLAADIEKYLNAQSRSRTKSSAG